MNEYENTEPIRGWAVVNPDMVIRMQIRATKRGAINDICGRYGKEWKSLYQEGYRCKRAVLALEEDKP